MANAILNVGQTGGQVNISTAAAPATPAAGVVTLYAGTDKALHVKNSDGTDITIAAGMTGPTGPAGSAGPTGSTGAAGPISLTYDATLKTYYTCTASPSSTCANSCNVIIGDGNMITNGPAAGRCNVVAIGNCLTSQFDSGSASSLPIILIGRCLLANDRSINIGFNQSVQSGIGIGFCNASANFGENIGTSNTSNGGFSIGNSNTTSFGSVSVGCNNTVDSCSTALGRTNATIGALSNVQGFSNIGCNVSCVNIMGFCNRTFTGATGTMVLGNSSVGGTGACNSVVIGNSAQTTGADTVTIGDVACSTAACAISIGNAACSTATNGIAIGNASCSTFDAGVAIGCNAKAAAACAIAIGCNAQSTAGFSSIAIGELSCTYSGNRVVAIGQQACGTNVSTIVGAFACGVDVTTVIGYNSTASGCRSTVLGSESIATACKSIAIGNGACAVNINSVALGPNITTIKDNTTHVNSLIAFGQAASITNAVGSTGGSVTLNWDNSNIQTVTLTSNITTLTKSNPIDGAVYTLFLTQGGTGGKTVSWGADVDWPSGTAPTLSTAAGAVDAVSLVYIAGVTGYYGNANLNFS